MIRKLFLAFVFVVLAACSNGAKVGPGLMLDATTTAYVIASPRFEELNPLVVDDPLMGPVSLVAMNYAARAALIELGGDPDKVNLTMDSGNLMAAVHNVVFFATGSHPVGLFVGGVIALRYYEENKNED